MSASIVFVSYAREDGTFVAALSEGLEATEAVRIVGDFNEIDFSEAWKARISQLIASAEMVFFIVSPASVASEVCRWELHTAEAVGAAITPIFFRAAAHGELPESLARRHGFSVETLGAVTCQFSRCGGRLQRRPGPTMRTGSRMCRRNWRERKRPTARVWRPLRASRHWSRRPPRR